MGQRTDIADDWTAYLAREEQGLRGPALEALAAVVAGLARAGPDKRRTFALRRAAEVVDRQHTTPVRHPLFVQVVGPELVLAIRDRVPGAARGMAGLCQYLYQCPDLIEQLAPCNTELALLRLALDHDNTDAVARVRLIEGEARYFRYTLHELPAGVLYGTDGATVEECVELLEGIAVFENLVIDAGVHDQYAELLDRCRLHFNLYREYRELGMLEGYAAFLQKRGVMPDEC